MRTVAAALAGLLVVAGCSSGGSGGHGSIAPTTSATVASPTPEPSISVDPNLAVCDDLHTYINDKIQPTFDRWRPNVNEFDKRIGRQLRHEATHMFSLETRAEGAVANAIHDEAKGLAALSVAIDEDDDFGIGDAANEANTALTEVRGACHF